MTFMSELPKKTIECDGYKERETERETQRERDTEGDEKKREFIVYTFHCIDKESKI